MEECPAGPAVITQMKLQAPLNFQQLGGRAGRSKEADRPHSEKVKERRKTQERSHSKADHQDNQGGMGSGEGRGGGGELNQTRKTPRSLARVKMLRTNVPRAGLGICAAHGLGTE